MNNTKNFLEAASHTENNNDLCEYGKVMQR